LRLHRSTTDEQQFGQIGGQLRPLCTAPLVADGPHERGTNVVDDKVELVAPRVVGCADRECSNHRAAPPHVAGPDRSELTGGGKLFDAVLTNRLQRSVASRFTALDDEEAVVGEVGQPVGDRRPLAPRCGDSVGGVDVEPGCEPRDPAQQRLIVR
jgi:hypothetical protein